MLAKSILYYDDALELFLQIPEDLIGQELDVRIMGRSSQEAVARLKAVFAERIGTLRIPAAAFHNRERFEAEEVWDLSIHSGSGETAIYKAESVSDKTEYVKESWNGIRWKPYWTRDSRLAIFARMTMKLPEVLDLRVENGIRLKAELGDSRGLLKLAGKTYKPERTIGRMSYFLIPLKEAVFEPDGTFTGELRWEIEQDGRRITVLCGGNLHSQGSIQAQLQGGKLTLQKEKKNVSVIGSCVSRDNFNSSFNPDYKQDFTFQKLQNQQSIISLTAARLSLSEDELTGIGDWEKKNLREEFRKDFFEQIRFDENDYLILDYFADVYFGVCLVEGSALTNNHWVLHKTDYYQARQADMTVLKMEDSTDAYFSLWKEAVHELFDRIAVTMPGVKVILHKARFTDRYVREDGSMAVFDNAGKVEAYNEWWSRFDDYTEKNFDVIPISINPKKMISNEHHKWGKFNVHYIDWYYHEFLRKLRNI